MPIARAATVCCLFALTTIATAQAQRSDVLYARVTTANNQVYEGFVRWDQNEGSAYDILNADKEVPQQNVVDGEELGGRHYDHCEEGLHIRWGHVAWHDGCGSGRAQGNIRFGHIQRLDVVNRRDARVTLSSGETLLLYSNSTDLGRTNRGILVDDAEGVEELDWNDIETIEFLPPTANRVPAFGERLYGTLSTRDGAEFTGYVTWDMDEIFGADTLDGRNGDGDHEIPFETIESIARGSSSSSIVTLRFGEQLTLRGSNDVNSDNRDIAVADAGFGQVRLDWDEFREVRFFSPPSESPVFPSVRQLRGTVFTTDGHEYSGSIRWDNDEEFSWEHLDGRNGGLDFDIEFGLIRSIERLSGSAARVTVLDGRSFDLSGSTDVDADNRGVVVTLGDGTMVLVDWDKFERVEFER